MRTLHQKCAYEGTPLVRKMFELDKLLPPDCELVMNSMSTLFSELRYPSKL